MFKLLDEIQRHEGFQSQPYIDPLVAKNPIYHDIPLDDFQTIQRHWNKLKVTFGYGNTYITKEEAEMVLMMRVNKTRCEVKEAYPHIKNDEVIDILTNMAFQIGLTGLSNFRNMQSALKRNDLKSAKAHGLDSKWARLQTPHRAKELMDKLGSITSIA